MAVAMTGRPISDTGGAGCRASWLAGLALLLAAALAAPTPAARPNPPPLANGSGSAFLIHYHPPTIDSLTVHNWRTVSFSFTRLQRPNASSTATTTTPQPPLSPTLTRGRPESVAVDSDDSHGRPAALNVSQAGNDNKDDRGDESSRNEDEVRASVGAVRGNHSLPLLPASVKDSVAGNHRGTTARSVKGLTTTTRTTTAATTTTSKTTTTTTTTTKSTTTIAATLWNLPNTTAAAATPGPERYRFVITSSNDLVAKPALWGSEAYDDSCSSEYYAQNHPALFRLLPSALQALAPPVQLWFQGRCYVVIDAVEGQPHNFTVRGLRVGRVSMSLALLADNGEAVDQSLARDNGVLPPLARAHLPVDTVRGQRTADYVFDSSAAAIAILITFGIGCCTDTDSVKKQLKHPVSLIIGFCCQFILMPVLAFGLAMILPVEKDVCFGLLCTACVPGGGLGHIAVIIGDADIPLSLTMNLISNVAMLGTAPLWIFVLGQYFQSDPNAILSPRIIPIYNFEIWLASIFLAYATGLVVNRFRPVVADHLLTWVIKPFLLLATILYITVGVYINMYVFELVNNYAVLGAVLLPLVGCLLGCTLALLCRQRLAFVKTIALETSSLNCLIVLAALRFSLKQPDADLASMVPIWVMFTIPGLYVALAILQRFYATALHHWHNRNRSSSSSAATSGATSEGGKVSPAGLKDYDVASALASRPGMAALSAPLVLADGAEDDPAHNEKVTVL